MGDLLSIKTGFSNKYRAWYDGLIYRIQYCGIKGKSLGLMQNLLKNRYQRAILNGQTSKWAGANIGCCTSGLHSGTIFFFSYKQCNKRPLLNNKTPFLVVKNTN